MANFTVEFARGQLPGPTYEDYNVGVTSICYDDARTHPIVFNNNVTGDYVVGWNWDNPSFGLPPGTIRIESFTDTMETVDVATGTVIPTTSTPNTLRDTSTGLNLTYPYTTPISNLSNIVENFNSTELECYDFGSRKYMNTRTRVIQYVLFDTAGHPGSIQNATYKNSGPV